LDHAEVEQHAGERTEEDDGGQDLQREDEADTLHVHQVAEQELTSDAREVEHLHEELAHDLEGDLNGWYVKDQQGQHQLEREPDADHFPIHLFAFGAERPSDTHDHGHAKHTAQKALDAQTC
jgi:hypothetical protein